MKTYKILSSTVAPMPTYEAIFANVNYQVTNIEVEVLEDKELELEGDRWCISGSLIRREKVYKYPELGVMVIAK
jgi:hypothetical protein